MNALYNLSVMFSAIDKMTGPTKKIFNTIKDAEKTIESGQKMAEYGKQLSLAGMMVQGSADKIMGALKSICEPSIELQDNLTFLSTVTTSTMGSVEKSMAATQKAAIDWEKKHSASAEDFTKAAYRMASANLNDIQSIEGTRVALTVAKATMGDACESASLLATVYNNMGDKTKNVRMEMTRLGDIITRTQQYYQISNLQQLSDGLSYAVPAAKEFGVSVEEVNAVLGLLNSAGLKGAIAGTSYAATMRQMTKASHELGFALGKNADGGVSLIKTIENIRNRWGTFSKMSDRVKMAFQRAFGDEGVKTIALLLDKTDDMNNALKIVTNSSGAAANAMKQMELKSPKEQLQIFQNNIDALKDSLAKNLLPAVTAILPKVISLVDKFGKFVEKHPQLTKMVLILLGIGGALLTIIAPILTVAGGFLTMTGYGIQGIGQISKGIQFLSKLLSSGKILDMIQMIGLNCRIAFSTVVRVFWSAASAVWNFTAALLANPITWIVLGVIALAVGAYLLIKNWNKVSAFFKGLWKDITMIFNSMVNWIKNNIITLIAIFFPFIGIPLLIIKNWNKIGPMLGKIFGGIGNLFSNLGKMAYQWGSNLLNNFIEGIKAKVSSLIKGLFDTAKQIQKFLGFHSPAEAGPGSTAHKWAPALMKMYETGIVNGAPRVQKAALKVINGVSNTLGQKINSSVNANQSFTNLKWAPVLIKTAKLGTIDSTSKIEGSDKLEQNGASLDSKANSTPVGSKIIHREKETNNKESSKQYIVNINGPVTIIANNPEDLWQQFKTLAEEAV